MEHISSSDTHISSASQEIPPILQREVLYRVHNSPPLLTVLNQMSQINPSILVFQEPFY